MCIRDRNNNTGKPISGLTHGFKVFSPDGANWNTTSGSFTDAIDENMYDGGRFVQTFSVTGSAYDTIGFGGFAIQSDGVPDKFNSVAFAIQVGPINPSYNGKTICIDSSFYPPGGVWLWALPADNPVEPDWDGERCFRIVNAGSSAGETEKVDSDQ